jgi:ankyrin repeat protein
VVRALLAAGADVNAKTNNGVTALMIAYNRSEDEVVQLLKEAGAKE